MAKYCRQDGDYLAFHDDSHAPRLIPAPQTPREIKAGKRPKLVANPAFDVPADAVEISQEHYDALLAAQAEGKQLMMRAGKPVAADRRIATGEARAIRRRRRDRLLAESDWTQLADAPLTTELKAEWARYRKALRDLVMDGSSWPRRPSAPAIKNGGA